jgi:aminopeptidase N
MFKNAVTSDFIVKANKINGSDLDWFFNEWIYHPNHPIYSNSYDIHSVGKGKWKIQLLVSQHQENTVYFKMPIQVRVVFADSTDKILKIFNNRNDQSFEFFFSKKPAYLEFDPFCNILLKNAITTLGIKPSNSDGGF